MNFKQCTKCEKVKHWYRFGRHERGTFGLYPQCFVCARKTSAQWRKENKAYAQVYKKKTRHIFYLNNREKILKTCRAYYDNSKANLTDVYIKNALTSSAAGLKKNQITPEMIDLKRQSITISRLKKQRRKELLNVANC